MHKFELPAAPDNQTSPVKAWSEPVRIPTYLPEAPDRNPMFLENRVYQGSSGRVYPLPFTDRIATVPSDHTWQALHIENEFIRVMVLPELGGRIHVGLDKTNGYDFFYRQNVIKPALVGLAGPWVSGGVEFNWPQHHRPATFLPVETCIEEHADGSKTIWCSDHDPMSRLKGMHGICLHPGSAVLELKVRLYNRTALTETFLWWANAGTHVHELYQSFFPPDVHYVADHAKRAMSAYPLCRGSYYGVDYGKRGLEGVPEDEQPSHFQPPGSYQPNDLSWYANIPVPTSYMAMDSKYDFCGGYDHKREAGLVHVANHHISPGKKQWTWGNHEFGYAWDRNLTDSDGPYIELMAGVYTDNQPDFSFLGPGETKTFSQYWYPIQKVGPVQQANVNAAASLQTSGGRVRVGVAVTRPFTHASIVLRSGGRQIAKWVRDLAPDRPFVGHAKDEPGLVIEVHDRDGGELVRYVSEPPFAEPKPVPPPATEPPSPAEVTSNDELYLIGLHLEQYRHATRKPEAYWREALRRDPGDSRCGNAMGLWHLRRGEFAHAEEHFGRAVARLTSRNPNPYDGEAYYNLGLALRFQGRDEEAYDAFYKATWNFAWRAAAYQSLGELDAKREAWQSALTHLDVALRHNADNHNARNLRVVALRKIGADEHAASELAEALALDPLNVWSRQLASQPLARDNQLLLDTAFDYLRSGLREEARQVLEQADLSATDGSVPMVHYTLGYLGKRTEAPPPDYCFPSRLDELIVLNRAIDDHPTDPLAPYYLGCWLYDRKRHREAIRCWQWSAKRDPSFATVWRNLGIAYYNVLGKPDKAKRAFEKAWKANPADARVLFERDQLWKRLGVSPDRRLAELTQHPALTALRDDLSVELAILYNLTGQPECAQAVLSSRKFQPWEGGEGLALGQHVRTHIALGRKALRHNDAAGARHYFEMALCCPENLSEAAHLLANRSNIYYWLGVALEHAGEWGVARKWWKKAAEAGRTGETYSEMTYFSAMAMERLDEKPAAENLLKKLLRYSMHLEKSEAKIDYFATSLPTMLLFEEDLQERNTIDALFLRAQAKLGLGQPRAARKLLTAVLAADPAHQGANELIEDLP